MNNSEIFESLISDQVRKKLLKNGISFSEFRKTSNSPEKLIEAIYRNWRAGNISISRNWKGLHEQQKKIPYSNGSCLLPDDKISWKLSNKNKVWKIATWNVNSIRMRLPLLLEWLEFHDPDAVCLQETKVEDNLFPVWDIKQAGYDSVFYGQKSYNGVAILSKHPINNVQKGFLNRYDEENSRIIKATVSGVRLINVYIPQGQTVESQKFKYKLKFFSELIQELHQEDFSENAMAIMGDFNVAPEARDLSNPKSMKNKVSFHPKEHDNLKKINNMGLVDIFRKFDQNSGKFSWWDFRTRGFERDEGMRIDYILTNSVLTSSCQACIIDILTRGKDRPSDHAPVIAEFIL
tara:strand:- start:298 stop:1344 length:1047 start_codon:yes stop_codon:yes gene_type:complete